MNKPLSLILRPETIDDIVGQNHLLNEYDGLINKMIVNNFLTNIIFYGPPGVGKTSLAISLANDLKCNFDFFNASNDKKEKLQSLIKSANEKQLVLIIDEFHRMNKNIQDYLLEFIESKKVIVFITTTENPYFVINPAIRSRCTILKLKELDSKDIFEGLKKIIIKLKLNLKIEESGLLDISERSNGDFRFAINILEIIKELYSDKVIDKSFTSSLEFLKSAKGSSYGDEFHDLKSAFQKSIRGSDVDASLHYFSRLLEIGDYETLMRRMIIIAYEDIGLANPTIPVRVYNACNAFRQIGMPEGRIILGLAVIEMALSEKSNSSILAIDSAISDIKNNNVPEIPSFLRDNNYNYSSKFNETNNYKYAHDYENDYVDQQYMPTKLKNKQYFKPKLHSNYEKKLIDIYNRFTNKTKK
ncbi:replication-associated recombination protein A [Spiroplasma turonicum]|uniref:Recombination factor protein RarA n=1 Tax=Spiroplasma turonicum TaxID=216946 RepID=A0A0K1P6Q6_9MOLU|nr:replication-associated recombination protein A [Spiroplasma turonicum]AKU79557.1 recombination factor protein RarA [Spiroplasma turonicum]ALX70580.1 recombination factor protein RarA [Spiroplasma turonicum]